MNMRQAGSWWRFLVWIGLIHMELKNCMGMVLVAVHDLMVL